MINKIKEQFLNKQFFSFFRIGLVNVVSSQGLYIIFILMQINSSISVLASDIITMVLSYFLNMNYTYHVKPSWKTFVTFPISYIPGWIINLISVMVCIQLLHIDKTYAKIISIPLTVPLNYLVMTFVVNRITKAG